MGAWGLCGVMCLLNTKQGLFSKMWLEMAGSFSCGCLFGFSPFFVCGGVVFPSQAPALLLCFVRPSLVQLALAPAHVGHASPFILMFL